MVVYVSLTVITVLAAVAILGVVAVSGGHVKFPAGSKWADGANRFISLLNAQGEPPRFLERLDRPRSSTSN